jgi:hypothetical protein
MPAEPEPPEPAVGVSQRVGYAAQAILHDAVTTARKPSGIPNGFVAGLFLVIVLLVLVR